MIYLDNAATTWPKPRQILDQMVELFYAMGAVRFSLGIFNTCTQIETTVAAMEQIAQ